ncbi:hypothetical protein ACIRL2_28410 [Embleya sp. NPDC127516]|uniref:hypothetical protein n=1 Tax=Embleya sp. NPDC127516 TaxID=3363990 RepID=UPI003825D25E
MPCDRLAPITIRVTDTDRSSRFHRDNRRVTEAREPTIDRSHSFEEHGITGATPHALFLRRDGAVVELDGHAAPLGTPISAP